MYRPSEEVLSQFVTESNAIERLTPATVRAICAMEYEKSPYWIGHMQAVEFALDSLRERQMPEIRGIHYLLMHDIPDVDPSGIQHHDVGDWRKCDVTVGGEKTPKPYTLPRLIDAWQTAAEKAIKTAQELPAHLRVDMCYQFHHWFECIHPFVDGNGRTGRILWNSMRVLCGLDWAIVCEANKQAYYDDIGRWRHSRWDSLQYHSLQREDDQIRIHVGGSDGV